MAGSFGVSVSGMATIAGSPPAVATDRPIDLVHLSKYTLGDKDLERQVLSLFATQSTLYIDRLRDAEDDRAWLEAAHTLKGSAKGVGAWRVARYAEQVENLKGNERADLGNPAIEELSESIKAVNEYIQDLMVEI